MILPNPKDALHKAWLYRFLINILNDSTLASNLVFKGGTCAAMLGILDRFSLDLDFDFKKNADKKHLRRIFLEMFTRLGVTVKTASKDELFFLCKYSAPAGQRNTLKISAVNTHYKNNKHRASFLAEIGRYAVCHTPETMFSHKLVAVTDRFEKHHTVAGRDIYDIHCFFTQGLTFNDKLIKERTGINPKDYLKKLSVFVENKFTQTIIDQDLNTLLLPSKFAAIRKTLKTETLMFIKNINTKT